MFYHANPPFSSSYPLTHAVFFYKKLTPNSLLDTTHVFFLVFSPPASLVLLSWGGGRQHDVTYILVFCSLFFPTRNPHFTTINDSLHQSCLPSTLGYLCLFVCFFLAILAARGSLPHLRDWVPPLPPLFNPFFFSLHSYQVSSSIIILYILASVYTLLPYICYIT